MAKSPNMTGGITKIDYFIEFKDMIKKADVGK